MDKIHVDLINKNLDKLVAKTHSLEEIVAKLKEEKVLNHYMAKYIFEPPDYKGQNTEFYKMIPCRGPNAFRNLLLALRETQNDEAEEILSSLKVSYLVTPDLVKKKSTSPRIEEDDSIDFCKVEDLVVKVHPNKIFMDLEETAPCESETYRMRSKPRGLALIINIFRARNQEDRVGSHVDVKKIQKLFSQIGYKIIIHSDLTAKDMRNAIRSFVSRKELSEVDSLVVFIMSHGRSYKHTEDVELIASDGLTLRTSWIINQFTADSPYFVSFENKPKLFFFQACRVLPNKTQLCEMEKNREESPPNVSSFKNTLITYSTCEGSPSMRDVKEGAWFVGEFCKVVAKQAWQHDLEIMLCAVEKAISKKKDERYGEQHMEIKKRGIKGKIYFNPGL